MTNQPAAPRSFRVLNQMSSISKVAAKPNPEAKRTMMSVPATRCLPRVLHRPTNPKKPGIDALISENFFIVAPNGAPLPELSGPDILCQEYRFRFTPSGDASMTDILAKLAALMEEHESELLPCPYCGTHRRFPA